MSEVSLLRCLTASLVLGGRVVIIAVATLVLAAISLESTALYEAEVINLISHAEHPVLGCGLINLHAGHGEAQHTCGAILCLEGHVVLECDIHAEQW